jgi:galactokinase
MVALIEREKAIEVIETLSGGYRDVTTRELTAYVSSPAAGARLLSQEELESL